MAPDMTRLYNPSEINNNNRSIIEINANIDDYVKRKKPAKKKAPNRIQQQRTLHRCGNGRNNQQKTNKTPQKIWTVYQWRYGSAA